MAKTTQICPCCGGDLFDRAVQWFPEGRCLVVGNQAVTLTKYHTLMFDLLWKARKSGGAVTKAAFFEALFGEDPNGGPEDQHIIYVELVSLRKVLEPLGFTIPTNTGRDPIYRLAGR